MRVRRLPPLATLIASAFVLLVTPVSPVSAQTSDELFDPSVLHDIQLTMKQSDWDTLQDTYLDNTYYRADMKWREVVVPMVGIRSRGSGSRNKDKPGLKVDFDRYVQQRPFGMRGLVLANAIQDPAMLKQRLGLGMFARMGMPAPRVVHARVFVNTKYIGLYELIEPIDKSFLGRVFGDDAKGKTENDGYLYEYQWKDAYQWDYLGSDFRLYSELFKPETNEDDAPSLLYGPLEHLFRTFNDVNDNQFESAVGEQLDLRQFVRHLAVENFIAEHDGFLGYWGPNNFYMYRFQGRKLAQLLPWDKDAAFWERNLDIFQGVSDNVLARRALQVPSLYRTYLEALIECATLAMAPDPPDSPDSPDSHSHTGWLEAEAQRVIAQIHAAGYADENKRFSNDRFDDELGKVLQFARDRAPFVAHEAANALAQMSSEEVPSAGNLSHNQIEPTQERSDFRLRDIPAFMWR